MEMSTVWSRCGWSFLFNLGNITKIQQFNPAQLDALLNAKLLEVIDLLEEVGFQATLNLSFGDGQ